MSKQFKVYAIVLIFIIVARLFCFTDMKPETCGVSGTGPVHTCKFYDEESFVESISRVKSIPMSSTIKGGVIPHHLVAGYMIADFFNMLSGQDIERVILIGPNHYVRGPRIITSKYPWQTAYGILEEDDELIDVLIKSGIAHVNEEVMTDEHSIAGLIPYIKYYLPEAKIVPLILHWDISLREAENLSHLLTQYVGKKSVIVASVDFSHYLTMEEAQVKDRETLKAIQASDYELLFNMGNDHLDSPASIGILLQAMKGLGAENLTVLHHSNSGIVLGRYVEETTSYFTLVYH